MDNRIVQAIQNASIPVELNVRPGEEVLILCDTSSDPLVWQALSGAVCARGASVTIAMMTPRTIPMANPTDPVCEALKAADVCFLTVTKAIIHSSAARIAMEHGTRFVNLEEATVELLWMTNESVKDYEWMQQIGQAVCDRWSEGTQATISAPGGTNLSFSVEQRPGYFVAGISRKQPNITLTSCAFPDGEAGVAPVENSANGLVVVDVAVLGARMSDSRPDGVVTLKIVGGVIEDVSGGGSAEEFRLFLDEYSDEGGYRIAEVSLGLNKKIRRTGNKADKKMYGTAHIGFGENRDVGGANQSRLHYDLVINKPALVVDGFDVAKDGEVLVGR